MSEPDLDDRSPSTQPYDTRKPQISYTKGWQFTVRQHTPPPPVKLNPYTLCSFEDQDESIKMELLHPIKRRLRYPPLLGPYGSSIELQICDTLRVGDCHNAQVVVVEILTADPPGAYHKASVSWLSYMILCTLMMMNSISIRFWSLIKGIPLRRRLIGLFQITKALRFLDFTSRIPLISLLSQQTTSQRKISAVSGSFWLGLSQGYQC